MTLTAFKPRLVAEPVEVQTWLEWAGATLLAMRLSSPAPRDFRVAWPEYAQSKHTAYGYTGESLRAALPDSRAIVLMDEILLLPNVIEDQTARRIVHARALVTPVSQRYVYSWTKIAQLLRSDRRRVAGLYTIGIRQICTNASKSSTSSIRQSHLLLTQNC